jgi:glycosyltransferase involved in cell wall biosynthesis
MSANISVIICTHNPRRDYLNQTLDSLKLQTLPKNQWELLIVDNASNQTLANELNITWPEHSKIFIREEKLGLQHARIRGIQEASSELLVFVDDDNVLNSDYLEQVLKISSSFPKMGVWGGSITGVFEIEPSDCIKKRVGLLAVGEVESDSWSTIKGFNVACPPGAGMVVRRDVALKYITRCQNTPNRCLLDRKGNSLTAGGEIDIAWFACEIGYGMGRFKDLKMKHLIGSRRLTVEYFSRLIEEGCYSNVFLYYYHGLSQDFIPQTIWAKLRRTKHIWKLSKEERIFSNAAMRGTERGIKDLASTQ